MTVFTSDAWLHYRIPTYSVFMSKAIILNPLLPEFITEKQKTPVESTSIDQGETNLIKLETCAYNVWIDSSMSENLPNFKVEGPPNIAIKKFPYILTAITLSRVESSIYLTQSYVRSFYLSSSIG